MKIDFLAREQHHIEHAKAIYNKIPEEYKGQFFIDDKELPLSKNQIVVCFSYGDLKIVDKTGKKAIYGEHGVGMYYNIEHPSYAGSLDHRDCVILRLSPNKLHADREKQILKCPVKIIGVPKMDKYHYLRERTLRQRRYPVVAISFHWDCHVCPETRTTFRYYQSILRILKEHYELLGHGHPRIFPLLKNYYQQYRIKAIENFDEVIKEVDIYICDNSSTIFEFAYTKKPVILLNSPMYRKEIKHKGNPRFWKYADIGIQVEKPDDLLKAIKDTMVRDYLPRQEKIVKDIFTYVDGKCAERASKVIINFLKTYEVKY